MSFIEVMDIIKQLAKSQGFYGRLYDNIASLPDEELNALIRDWNGKFEDALDFVLYIEGQI